MARDRKIILKLVILSTTLLIIGPCKIAQDRGARGCHLLFFKRATRSSCFGKESRPRLLAVQSRRKRRGGKDDQQRMEAAAGTPSEIVCEEKKKKKKNNAMLYGGRKKKTWLATFGQLIITLEGGFDN